MTKAKRIIQKILCFAFAVLFGGELLLSAFSLKANALNAEIEERNYSNVLDDLKKDENFNVADFPDNPTDYSLQVITVAEGNNGELFVYVYQPSNATKDLRASKINMSLVDPTTYLGDNEPTYDLYDLTWINSSGVFDKYIVNGVNVSSDPYRYYDITAIYRTFDASLGDISNVYDGDITNYKAFPVGKFWTSYYYNGVLHTESAQIDIVPITYRLLSYVSYDNGTLTHSSSCYGYFVAFKVEGYDVEQIYDADITYTYTKHSITNGVHSTFDPVTITDYISDKETGGNGAFGILGKKYTWERIVDITTFKDSVKADANHEFTEEQIQKLSDSEFVFRFAEFSSIRNTNTINYTDVNEVSILRLHFLTPLGTYNLGAVSDIVSGSNSAFDEITKNDNIQNTIEETLDGIKMIFAILIFILLFVVLGGPIRFIFGLLYDGLKFIFNFLIYLISIPFKIIAWIFRR